MTDKTKGVLKHLLAHNQAKAMLNARTYPYILVTCNPDGSEGDVDVELSFHGNEDLLSYIMEQVGDYFQAK
ncbi:hypothetical protein COB21_02115 [Candidatus Aerophobetes bacterium]|uniref:Uncharacterized protein n=1 Tax=Aerophobetes bacterium TaxID=2030807 RepID=A0A2A4X7G0_UNCAE|nr:MAG: hypothetical protein COB21_02115 [Candidatus Aerophobetes bacterium]